MLKIINCLLLIVLSFLSTTINAKTIKLGPNETKVLANNLPWTVNATCNIQSNYPVKGKVRVMVLKHKGSINGKSLSSGQAASVTVKNKSNISISADSGTQINLINLGSQHLEAVCSI